MFLHNQVEKAIRGWHLLLNQVYPVLYSTTTINRFFFFCPEQMVLAFFRSVRGIACLEGVYRLERHFIRTPVYHQDEKIMVSQDTGVIHVMVSSFFRHPGVDLCD